MAKRVIFVACAFGLEDPIKGLMITIFTATFNAIFVLNCRPFKKETANKFEAFNEVITSMFLMTLLSIIGDYGSSVGQSSMMVWVVISTLMVYITVHLVYQFQVQLAAAKYWYKSNYAMRAFKQHVKDRLGSGYEPKPIQQHPEVEEKPPQTVPVKLKNIEMPTGNDILMAIEEDSAEHKISSDNEENPQLKKHQLIYDILQDLHGLDY